MGGEWGGGTILVTRSDVGDKTSSADKKPVASASRCRYGNVYGDKIVNSGPLMTRMRGRGNTKIVVSFRSTTAASWQSRCRDYLPTVLCRKKSAARAQLPLQELEGFAIRARITGCAGPQGPDLRQSVIVWSPDVSKRRVFRYRLVAQSHCNPLQWRGVAASPFPGGK